MGPRKSCWDLDAPYIIDTDIVTPGSHKVAPLNRGQMTTVQSSHVDDKAL